MEDYSGVEDRRKYLRLRTALFVCFSPDKKFYIPSLSDEQEVEASTIDISQGGMALATRYNIPPNAILNIKCLLLGVNKHGEVSLSRPIELNGEVRYNATIGNNEYCLGINFAEISREDKKQIGNYISSISRGDLFACNQPK